MFEEAKVAVYKAYESDGRYVEAAQSLLQKLDQELGDEASQADVESPEN
jgi:hypothetical protein